ncbi:MAG: ZIP family metal transporter [Candidatus Shapirobacteria bacterium]|nr:ZIP family metal transporter [Candidatus Shapirobacteria bacterium]
MSPLVNSLLSTFIVSLISFLGILFIFIKPKTLSRITLFLVSFAIGSLLGDAFIHLIPESFKQFNFSLLSSLLILSGIILFFILEKFIHWHHCHQPQLHQFHHVVSLNLIGDSVHNFIDGALIAASFNVSFFVGLTTSLAVILHEIPQEIGDFGIFIHHGILPKKALFYNFLSALTSLLGVAFVFIVGSNLSNFSNFLIPITAGGFIYLAATDLIPELHRHNTKVINSLIQLVFIILGIALMSLLIFLE